MKTTVLLLSLIHTFGRGKMLHKNISGHMAVKEIGLLQPIILKSLPLSPIPLLEVINKEVGN